MKQVVRVSSLSKRQTFITGNQTSEELGGGTVNMHERKVIYWTFV